MRKYEVRDIKDPEVVADLLKAKYIVDLDATKSETKTATKKTSKGGAKKTSKGGAKK